MPVWFIFLRTFLSINEINLLSSKRTRKFCRLGASLSAGMGPQPSEHFSSSRIWTTQSNQLFSAAFSPGLCQFGLWLRVQRGWLSACWLNARRQLQHREPRLLCENLGKSSVCFSAAMCMLLQRTPEWLYPCSVKTDSRDYRLQEEIVTHQAGQAWCCRSWVTFQHCCKHNGLLPNFHQTFSITLEFAVPQKKWNFVYHP